MRTLEEQLKIAESLLNELQNDIVGVVLSKRIKIRTYFGEHERGELINYLRTANDDKNKLRLLQEQ